MTVESLPTAARSDQFVYDVGSDSVDASLTTNNEQTIIVGYFAACAHVKKLLKAARTGGDTSKLADVFTALSAAEAWLIDNGYRTYLPTAVNVSTYVRWDELVLHDLIAVRRDGERVVRYCERTRRHVERLISERSTQRLGSE